MQWFVVSVNGLFDLLCVALQPCACSCLTPLFMLFCLVFVRSNTANLPHTMLSRQRRLRMGCMFAHMRWGHTDSHRVHKPSAELRRSGVFRLDNTELQHAMLPWYRAMLFDLFSCCIVALLRCCSISSVFVRVPLSFLVVVVFVLQHIFNFSLFFMLV